MSDQSADAIDRATEAEVRQLARDLAKDGAAFLTTIERLQDVVRAMDSTLDVIYNLDPEGHATKSRDYGRGFAEALRVVKAEIDGRMGEWAGQSV